MSTRGRKPKRKKVEKKICVQCKKDRPLYNFYVTNSPLFPDGRVNTCKGCLLKNVDVNDIESVKRALRLIDKPYIASVWASALNATSPFGDYLRMISSLPQYKNLTWEDSVENIGNKTITDIAKEIKAEELGIDEELLDFWGREFEPDEIKEFQYLYEKWIDSYQIATPMHEAFLKMAIIYNVKATRAAARGDTKEAESYMKMFKDATSGGKLQPSQMSRSDLSGGIDTFSQLVKEVEKAVDIIEILPEYKTRPQDKVDFAIYCYVSYIRNLQGLPPIEYKDIYAFYEERKKEFAKNNPEAEDW